MENSSIIWQRKINLWKECHFVENKMEIMQNVLKMEIMQNVLKMK